MTPRATYRLQFHRDFTFADAEEIVPYLDALGISHIYASPITTALPGSLHGYDVADPTQVNPELGGDTGLRRLWQALRERGMGLIIDIVPNHMGIGGSANRWWHDVLEHGPSSRFARFFDIDWRSPLMLPVLGSPLPEAIAQGNVTLVEADGRLQLQVYGPDVRLPLRPDDPVLALRADQAIGAHDPQLEHGREALAALAGRQHFRLAYWRTANDLLNWRRFFSVNELAGLRAEDPEVFEATHALACRLFSEGVIDGVRVDHVDGLTDPAAYCRRLISSLEAAAPGRRPYVVVEKILARGEHLPPGWGVDGTSGYDFMAEVTALLHDPNGQAPLSALWAELSGRGSGFAQEELEARRQLLAWEFEGQLRGCVEAFAALAASLPELAWITDAMLRRAIECLLWVFPVYRTYGTGSSAPPGDEQVREAVRHAVAPHLPPGEAPVATLILEWLKGTGEGEPELVAEAVRRFQQLSAPIAAKAVEDTAFYRYGVLLSANEVGSDPECFSLPVAEFHATMAGRVEREPYGMLALATHDHKRGPDARARLAVLSGAPEFWGAHARRWIALAAPDAEGVHGSDLYMLLQTLVGAWDESATDNVPQFLERVQGWQEKALREAKLRSSWVAPDLDYEGRCKALAEALLAAPQHGAFRADFAAFMQAIAPAAWANSLAQTALQLAGPGVPDIYQGSELLDLSLVDPDNRRPVDYGRRRELLAEGGERGPGTAKLHLVAEKLSLRRANPALFAEGDYRPLEVSGARAGHVVAFARRHGQARMACAVAIRLAGVLVGADSARPPAHWWKDTLIETGAGDLRPAAELFATSVVFVQADASVG